MRSRQHQIKILCCILPILAGMRALIGYWVHSQLIVRFPFPHGPEVVINTAMGLILCGAALLLLPRWPRLAAGLGALLATVSLGVMFEGLAQVNLGLDERSWHAWLGAPDYNPGRMAINTSLVLVLLGLAVVLIAADHRRWERVVRFLTWTSLAITTAGAAGYLTSFDALYAWTDLSRMAPATAGGLLLLGLGLWLSWRDATSSHSQAVLLPSRRMLATAMVALAGMAVVGGMVGFFLLHRTLENNTEQHLALQRDVAANFLSETLRGRAIQMSAVAVQPELINGLRDHDDTLLHRRETAAISYGFNAAAVFDTTGRLLASTGQFASPDLAVRLNLPAQPVMEWAGNGYYIREDLPVRGANGQLLGLFRVEQPMSAIDHFEVVSANIGQTGRLCLCAAPEPGSRDVARCFPDRFRPAPYQVTAPTDNVVRPVMLALRGTTAWAESVDVRNHRIIAAYGPVGATGLVLSAQMDLDEFYDPIRTQFLIMLPLLALLVLIGAYGLRWQLRPLLAEIASAHRQAVENEARFRAAAESGMDAFCILQSVRDAHGQIADFRLSYANPTAASMFDAVAAGKHETSSPLPVALATPDFRAKCAGVVASGKPLEEEIEIAGPGSARWLHRQLVPMGHEVAMTARDISGRKANELRLHFLAQYDSLTGLHNRAAFLDRLNQAMRAINSGERGPWLALLYVDLDDLKVVNDTKGHAAGDRLLRALAARLLGCTRETDTVGRIGGDEFTVLLENIAHTAQAEQVVHTVSRALAQGNNTGEPPISASIGVALFHGGPLDAEGLIHQADNALYQAKQSGRNRFAVFSS